MNKQHGGVKKIDPLKSDYELFIEMMNSPEATFQLLTDKCKNGIIFVLHVQPHYSKYVTLGPTGTFNQHVTSFVVKFVITYSENDVLFGKKFTMTPESFLHEAQIQQDIFIDSIVGKRQPLCPGICGFFLFDHTNAIPFLNKLLSVPSVDVPSAKTMIEKLLRIVQSDRSDELGIGCILMENIDESETLGDFIDGCHFHALTEYEIEIFVTLIAQLIRLYLISKKVHLDLHPGNILIQRENVYIIDFGLLWETTGVGDVRHPTRRGSFNPEIVRNKISQEIPLLSNNLYADAPLTEKEKVLLVKDVMNNMETLDKVHLKQEFPEHFADHGQQGQMTNWWEQIKKNKKILLAAFNKFNEMHAVNDLKLPRGTLISYVREKRLINLSLEPQNYQVDVAAAHDRIEKERRDRDINIERDKKRKKAEEEIEEVRENPTISPWSTPELGGKRKSKKTKKLKKTKKTRKIRNKSKNKN
jgi:serine/threonine protein kinase